MSVERTVYIGIYVDVLDLVEDVYSEELLPYLEGHKGIEFDLIYDGMCGNYAYFGKTFTKLEYYDEKDYIFEDNYEKQYEDIHNELSKLGININEKQLRLMIFNHFSW